jgi:hypothetical protein
MSSTNPQIKSRADALAVGLSGAGAVVSKVANTSTNPVLNAVTALFTTIPVTDSLVSAVETLTANSGILEIAISEAQDAISTVSASKWQSAIGIANGRLVGSSNGIDYSITTPSIDLLLGGAVVATVPFTVNEAVGWGTDSTLGTGWDTIVFEYDKSVSFDSIRFTGTSYALIFHTATWNSTDHYWIMSGGVDYGCTGGNDTAVVNPVFNISNVALEADRRSV